MSWLKRVKNTRELFKCQYPEKCQNFVKSYNQKDKKTPKYNYCEHHLCKTSSCGNQTQSSTTNYCTSHTCIVDECTAGIKKGPYCSRHICSDLSCEGLRTESSYCIRHTCSKCNTYWKNKNHYYCDLCECNIPRCNGAKEHSYSLYCIRCECVIDGCYNNKLDDDIAMKYSKYCRHHEASQDN